MKWSFIFGPQMTRMGQILTDLILHYEIKKIIHPDNYELFIFLI
jgi:hypothetical protein